MTYKAIRVIISGGGTGGHIFPAISIADKLREVNPESEILFVGAEGKMEMEKVPAAGYEIVGLPIVGLQRKLNMRNILNDALIPGKVLGSVYKARKLIKSFKPDVVIGVGGYASAPLLWAACHLGVPTLIQEQNGFAGLTNRILAKRVNCICVAYEGMEKFFPAEKIVMSGNPIRSDIVPASAEMKAEAMKFYGLDPAKKHLLVVGGSLGSGTLNKSIKKWIEDGCPSGGDVEVLWQCGRYYKNDVDSFMQERASQKSEAIKYSDFIGRMDLAYAAADIVISRSGASSISELCAAQKACIFVPSPNVAEDHQTHNAMALVRKDAAMLVPDAEAGEKLLKTAMELIHNKKKIEEMEKNIAPLALRDAAGTIVEEAYKLI